MKPKLIKALTEKYVKMSILVKPYSDFVGVHHYTKRETEHIRWYEGFKAFCRPLRNVDLEDIESKTNKHTDIFELPIKDITDHHIRHFRYVQSCVEYDEQELNIDPYIFGLWLGDGNAKVCALTTVDLPVANIWCEYLKRIGLDVHGNNKKNRKTDVKIDESDQVITYLGTTSKRIGSGYAKPNTNKFLNELRRLNVFNAKHIPDVYLKNSKENRLKLLAGLIDTDGCLHTNTSYEIVQKSETLANNIVELCQSLGFFTSIKSTTKRCTNSKNPEHMGIYYRIFISVTFHTPTIPLQIERKKNVKPQPGNENQNSNFPKFDNNGNPISDRDKKKNTWTLDITQKLYNIVETFKQLEPKQNVPWKQIKLLDPEFQPFAPTALKTQYDSITGKHKQIDWLKKHIEEIQENFIFQNIDPKKFIENDWFDKYKKALKHLEEHSDLSIYTTEGAWYHNQRKYYDSVYIIKKQLLDNIQEKIPESKRALLVDQLNHIKHRYHNGELIENISLINDRLYIPSTTKYNDIGRTVQNLQTAVKRGELWDGFQSVDYIEMYKPLLHEIHLDPNICMSGSLIYKTLPESDELIDFYTSAVDAAKSIVKDGKISSFEVGKRKISKASNIQGVEYGYKWVNCSLPGVYNFETTSSQHPPCNTSSPS